MENENGNLPYDPEKVVEREMKVAGKNVKVLFNKDDLEIPIGSTEPEGLEGTELEQWKGIAGNELKAMKVSNDKYVDAAKLKREIEEERLKLEEDRKKWKQERDSYKPPTEKVDSVEKPNFYKILSDLSGEDIRDLDDELEFEEDNKKVYRKAKRIFENAKDDYLLSQSRPSVSPSELVEKSLLRNQIEQDGSDYASVESFAKLRGWKVNSYSYDAFKNANPKQTSETKKINKYAQPTEFVWITPGNKVQSLADTKPLTDMFDNLDDLENWVELEMKKEKPDPRAIEFMKDED